MQDLEQSLLAARVAAQAAAAIKATSVNIIDVHERLALTDAFVIVSAESERQVQAIADEVDRRLHLIDIKQRKLEGQDAKRWLLVDYGPIVVHIFCQEDHVYYDLERLWKDCPTVEVDLDADETGRAHEVQGGAAIATQYEQSVTVDGDE